MGQAEGGEGEEAPRPLGHTGSGLHGRRPGRSQSSLLGEQRKTCVAGGVAHPAES